MAPSGGISVYYVGTDQNLYELGFSLTSWNNGNLTVAGHGPHALLGTGLSSFLAPSGGISVYYVSAVDQSLHEMNFNTHAWIDGNLTTSFWKRQLRLIKYGCNELLSFVWWYLFLQG